MASGLCPQAPDLKKYISDADKSKFKITVDLLNKLSTERLQQILK